MSEEKTPSSKELVSLVADALRTYTHPYHIEYPRLLSQGFTKKKIGLELSRDEDIVDYHVDTFFSKVPGLRGHSEIKEIIADGIKEWKWRGSPLAPPPPIQGVRRSFHSSSAPVRRAAPRHDLVNGEEEFPPGTIPTKKHLARGINRLTFSQRMMLDVLMSFPEMPTRDEIVRVSGKNWNTASSTISLIFSELGLDNKNRSPEWKRERFILVKEAYQSEGIIPLEQLRRRA